MIQLRRENKLNKENEYLKLILSHRDKEKKKKKT